MTVIQGQNIFKTSEFEFYLSFYITGHYNVDNVSLKKKRCLDKYLFKYIYSGAAVAQLVEQVVQ